MVPTRPVDVRSSADRMDSEYTSNGTPPLKAFDANARTLQRATPTHGRESFEEQHPILATRGTEVKEGIGIKSATYCSPVTAPRPGGRLPLKTLLLRLRYVSPVKVDTLEGIEPTRLLPGREILLATPQFTEPVSKTAFPIDVAWLNLNCFHTHNRLT